MPLPLSRTWKAAILSSGQFFVTLNGIVLAAILARLFSKQDYAAYQQTLLTYNVAAPLLMLGLPNALFYFIPRDRSKARGILTGNLLLLILAGGFFAVALWCGGNELMSRRFHNPAIRSLLLIYAPYAIFALPASAANACLLSCGRATTSAVFSAAARAFTLLCVVAFVLILPVPRAAISGVVAAEFVVFIAAVLIMYRIAPGVSCRPEAANIWDQMCFAVPLGLASMLGVMSRSMDKVIVSSMCRPELFAIYVNGAIDIPLIGILTGSINSVLLPEIVELYKKGDGPAALALWKRAAVKCSIILLPVMCFLFVMAPEVMRLLFSSEYEASAIPFRMYLLLVPIRIVAWGPMLIAAGKNSWILSRTTVSLGLNVVLSIFFVHYLGYMGAIVASIIELYLWHTPFYCVAISRLYGCRLRSVLPLREVSVVMLMSCLACIVFVTKPFLQIISSDLARIGIYAIMYASVLVPMMVLSGVVSPARVRALMSVRKRTSWEALDAP